MKHVYVLPILMAFAFFTAAGGPDPDKRFEKKFTAPAGGTLTLDTDAGSVTVTGSPENEVSIVAVIRGKTRDVEDFDVSAEQNAGGVDVHAGSKGGHNWFWHSSNLDVEFTIRVPRTYNLQLKTAGGDLDVSQLQGAIKGRTSGGNIEVRGVEGDLDMGTSGGNVSAAKVTGDVMLETSGGEVDVSSIKGEVDARTSGGNVRIKDVDGKVRAHTSGGDIVVELSGGNKGIHAETSGGDIHIALAKDAPATIDASTSSGDVSCDLPVTMSGHFDESRVRGTVNGGGNVIYAHTSGGDVRIRALP